MFGIDSPEVMAEKAAKKIAQVTLPLAVRAAYKLVKTDKQVTINGYNGLRNAGVTASKGLVIGGLSGKTSKAAQTGIDKLPQKGFNDGADSIDCS